jgi:hypothetical protein
VTAAELDAALARIEGLEQLRPVPAAEVSYDLDWSWARVEGALWEAWDALWRHLTAFSTVSGPDVLISVGYLGRTRACCRAELTSANAAQRLAELAQGLELKSRLMAVAFASTRTMLALAAAAHAPAAWTLLAAVRNAYCLAEELRSLSAAFAAATPPAG